MRATPYLATLTALLLAAAGCETTPDSGPTRGSGPDRNAQTADVTGVSPPGASPADDLATGSATPSATEPAVEPPDGPVAETVWRTEEVAPVSTPEVIGGTLVLYTVSDEELSITGLDPADGSVLWTHPATPSQSVGGVNLAVSDVAGSVVHLAPVEGRYRGEAPAVVVLRDPRTGAELQRSTDPLSHGALPGPCRTDDQRVCARIRVDGLWTELGLMGDGSFSQVPASAATGWSGIGPLGLSRRGNEGTELARVRDGEVLWQADTEALFAPDHSTNSGWAFQAFADDALLVGSVGTRSRVGSFRIAWDLPAYRTVGIDSATGERRWLAERTSAFCDTDVTGADEDPLLACVWHSGERVTVQGESTFHDLDVDLVRLDPSSGEALWTVPLPEPVWDDGQVPPVLRPVDDGHVSVETVDGPVVIDVESGRARPGGPSDVVWVEEDPYHVVAVPGSREDESRVTGTGRFVPRDAAGARAGAVPWPLPPTVTTEVEDPAVQVVTDRRGLTAYGRP